MTSLYQRFQASIRKITTAPDKYEYLIILILCLGLILRVVGLNQVPSGLHADEASFLLNTESLRQTARDEDGRFLPLTLHSLIDPKPALYSYLQIPFITVLGPTIAASRLPSAILGTWSLFLVYALIKKFEHKSLGLLMALLLAISPWHIMASRATQEVITSFFFFLIYLNTIVKFIKTHHKKHLLLLLVSGWLSMYMYHAAKVFLPLFTFALVLFWKKIRRLSSKQLILLVVLVLAAFIGAVVIQESSTRFAAVGVLSSERPAARTLEYIYAGTGSLPQPLLRAIYNKPIAYLYEIAQQYLSHFDPDFLFFKGGEPKRYLVPSHGLFYLIDAVLMILGFYYAVIKSKQKKFRQVFYLFAVIALLAPLPAALTTQEIPSMIRTFPLVLSGVFFIAMGFKYLSSVLKGRYFRAILIILLLAYVWQISYFAMQFAVIQKKHQPWYRNHPYSEIAQRLRVLKDDYHTIRVTNDLRPLYAYFVLEDLITIEQLQAQPLARNQDEYKIDKYEFNRGDCQIDEIQQGILYVAESRCELTKRYNNLQVVTTVPYPDGTQMYELLAQDQSP